MSLFPTTSRTNIASASGHQLRWDPEEVLKLCLDGRCVGHTLRHRNCRNLIGYGNLQEVRSLLVILARHQPDPQLLRPTLRDLAEHGLCLRNHKPQIDKMTDEWSSKISAAFPVNIDQTQEQRPAARSRPMAAIALSSQVDTTSGHLTQRPRSSSDADPPGYGVARPANADSVVVPLAMSPLSLSPTSSTASGPSRRGVVYATSRIATGSVSSTDRPAIATVPAEISERTSSITPLSSTIPSPNVSHVSPRPRPQRCTRPHARHLPYDEECPICYEGHPLSEYDTSEVVWCRSSCGRTTHKACFEDWRAQCVIDGRRLACAVCRSNWDEHSGCNSCDAVHARRQSIEGDCAICCDVLVEDESTAASVGGLVWCNSSCRQSVHQKCFDIWMRNCVADGRAATCVSCRALWGEECEC